MRKLLLVLALLAATLAALAAIVLNLPLGFSAPRSAAVAESGATLDHFSFALGLFTGAVVMWIVRMPVSALQYVMLRWRLGWKFNWRRRVAFIGLVAFAAGVLLLY